MPALVPYLEMADGRVIVAGDGADEIVPGADGRSLRVMWKRWPLVNFNSGKTEAEKLYAVPRQFIDPGLNSEVNWQIDGDTLVRTETITATKPVTLRRFFVMFPSTGDRVTTRFENGRRTDRFHSPDGSVEVTISDVSFPSDESLQATGNSAAGKGTRGAIPLIRQLQATNLVLKAGDSLHWTIRLRELPE